MLSIVSRKVTIVVKRFSTYLACLGFGEEAFFICASFPIGLYIYTVDTSIDAYAATRTK